ncbi:MAG: FAD:protein FMN transferase [Chromatiales bacterium]|nr:FAD:protein FMN transferase [Chromatiales bacterium]
MLTLTLALVTGAVAARATDEPSPIRGATMGTYYAIHLGSRAAVTRAVGDCTGRVLARIDALLSTWRSDSEIARFNASRSVDWVAVSPATAAVVAEAIATSELTGGAFDPTIGAVLAAWGLGPYAGSVSTPPTAAATADLRARVGHRRLRARARPSALRKTVPDLQVDLSAMAKGLAVDALAATLERAGIGDYLIDIGGEMRARGERPGGGPWRIGLERPDGAGATIARAVAVTAGALATSGTYRRRYPLLARTVPDIVDPRTAAPVEHALRVVSVLDASATRADALATALLVLGPTDGPELARRLGVAALLGTGGAHPAEIATPAFTAATAAAVDLPAPAVAAVRTLLETVDCAD